MKKKLKISALFFVLISIFGCSWNNHVPNLSKEKLLLHHLQTWQQFNADGIVEANYQNFVFRKNINLRKDNENIAITIFDAGIFGMSPQPFLSLKIDSVLTVKTQTEPEKIFELENFPGLDLIQNPLAIMRYKQEIIQNNELLLSNNTRLKFSKQMQIEEINMPSTTNNIKFYYQTDLSRIEIFTDSNLLAKIEIDKISYNNKN